VNLNVNLPPGSTMDDSRRVGAEIQQRVSKYKEAVHVTTTLSPRSASTFVTLVEREDRQLSQQQLQQKMAADLRGIPGVRVQSSSGRGSPGNGPLQIELTGDDSAVLTVAAANVE